MNVPPQSKWQKRRDAAWPFLLAGTITFCSGFPAAVPTIEWISVDKLGHFAAYGALASAMVRNDALRRWPWLGAWWAVLLTSAYGLGDEFRQSFTIVRMFEWDDWVADTLGASTAVVLYLRWAGYRRLMEMPLWRKRAKPTADNAPEKDWPQKAQEAQK
jgi:VanZ family protein